MIPETCYVGIGSNVGDRAAWIEFALGRLDRRRRGVVSRLSEVYETEPVGPVEQGRFLNAVAEVRTDWKPHALLQRLHEIERRAGRVRAQRWGPRTLDLDLLLYGQRVIREENITVPHPRLHQRWFVLKPLCDLAPDVVHPILKRSMSELLERLEPPGR